ncbi:MAG: hypothetical protein COB41_05010 [Proteobacteria bacterium]|nr:MAG: hypothetical protein COB41_05010 [Pseudomonadota bacterium]
MLVSCPQCKAKYQLATTIKNAILVCHRCGTEFHANQAEKKATSVDHELSLFEHVETAKKEATVEIKEEPEAPPADHEPALPAPQTDETDADVEQHDIPHIELSEERLLPERGQTRIWHWLILVLLCISLLGIWNNQKQWLAQPWMRSLMMNMKFSVTANPADWRIIKDSLHSQWIDRQDDSRVLFIDGYIQNRLLSDQAPPAIQVNFFDMPNSHSIQTRTITITEPPSLPTIRHAPYIAPAVDQIPVRAGGQRAFTLVIENVPEQARELSINITQLKDKP